MSAPDEMVVVQEAGLIGLNVKADTFIPWTLLAPLVRSGMSLVDFRDAVVRTAGLPLDRWTIRWVTREHICEALRGGVELIPHETVEVATTGYTHRGDIPLCCSARKTFPPSRVGRARSSERGA